MEFVLLRLEVIEEPANGVYDEGSILRRKIPERNVEAQTADSSRLLEVVEVGFIPRLGPRLNRAFVQRFALIGDDQIEIEIDSVPESLTSRARAERTVKRKKLRLRIFVPNAAFLALERFAESEL